MKTTPGTMTSESTTLTAADGYRIAATRFNARDRLRGYLMVAGATGGTVPLFMVGHSFGGQALGLLPNHHRVSRLYTFATGAGWHG